MVLNENISKPLVDSAKKIGKRIIQECQASEVKFSNVNNVSYVESQFEFDVGNVFPSLKTITVKFVMYLAHDELTLKRVLNNVGVCYSSIYKQEIGIKSGFVYNQIDSNFYGKIAHELKHLFEYDNGMTKREDLYGNAVGLMNHNNALCQVVGKLLYYSFPHEQDGFCHRFYTDLIERGDIQSFDGAIKGTSFAEACVYYNEAKKFKNSKWMTQIANFLGIKKRLLLKYIHFGMKRFNNKMYNAYTIAQKELLDDTTKFNTTLENLNYRIDVLRENTERFGFDLIRENESFYDFGQVKTKTKKEMKMDSDWY